MAEAHGNYTQVYCMVPVFFVPMVPDARTLHGQVAPPSGERGLGAGMRRPIQALPDQPDSQCASEAGASSRGSDERSQAEAEEALLTTVMLRNLPLNYTRTMLLDMLDKEGFSGRYDFAYLPTDFQKWAGFGYAFVNFATHEEAKRAQDHFQGFDRWKVPTQKKCEVTWSSPYQGLKAHIERYRNSPVMHARVPDECKPVVFSEGRRYAFPAPTKKIKAPHLRRRVAVAATR